MDYSMYSQPSALVSKSVLMVLELAIIYLASVVLLTLTLTLELANMPSLRLRLASTGWRSYFTIGILRNLLVLVLYHSIAPDMVFLMSSLLIKIDRCAVAGFLTAVRKLYSRLFQNLLRHLYQRSVIYYSAHVLYFWPKQCFTKTKTGLYNVSLTWSNLDNDYHQRRTPGVTNQIITVCNKCRAPVLIMEWRVDCCLRGQVAIVTGGAQGIGLGIACSIAAQGCRASQYFS